MNIEKEIEKLIEGSEERAKGLKERISSLSNEITALEEKKKEAILVDYVKAMDIERQIAELRKEKNYAEDFLRGIESQPLIDNATRLTWEGSIKKTMDAENDKDFEKVRKLVLELYDIFCENDRKIEECNRLLGDIAYNVVRDGNEHFYRVPDDKDISRIVSDFRYDLASKIIKAEREVSKGNPVFG